MLVDCLLAEGVDAVFGNPGTTELPLMEALASREVPAYYLGLQEIVCLGMADGYTQATGRPALVNLHAGPGLGNAMGNLFNAWRGRSPLVVTAGQQDTRFDLEEPLLHADLVRLASQYSKWAWELKRPEQVPAAVRRAFKEASSPPTGPVFLSLPMDLLNEETAAEPQPPVRVSAAGAPEPEALDAASELLSNARRMAIVAGDRVDRAGARRDLVALAEALGAAVWAEPLAQRLPFLPEHRLFAGFLPPFGPVVKTLLGDADVVLVVGGEAFLLYPPFEPVSPFPDGASVVHLDDSPQEIGKVHPVDVGLVCGIRAGIQALRDSIKVEGSEERGAEIAAVVAQFRAAFAEQAQASEAPPSAAAALTALSELFPGRIVVDEAVSSSAPLQRAFSIKPPDERYGHRTGGLGWGPAAALGVSLARRDRRTLCVVGDGSALYAIQGLWTAARYELPVTFVILDNAGYEIIKAAMRRQGGPAAGAGRYPGMDIGSPAIDWEGLARGFGLNYAECLDPSTIAATCRDLERDGAPALMRLPISSAGFELP